MGVTWRHLAGATDRFAIELALMEDPDNGGFAPPEVGSSWGEFRLFVGGRNLCEAKEPSGETSAAVRWYLLPLLRFFAENWELIAHEGRLPWAPRLGTFAATQMASTEFPPVSAKDDVVERWHEDWWQFFTQHCLASAREGGIFPNVWVRRTGNDIEVSWDNESNPAELPLRFLERSGVALVPVADFADATLSIVSEAASELLQRTQHPIYEEIKEAVKRVSVPDQQRRWLRHSLLLDLGRRVANAVELVKRVVERSPSLRLPDYAGPFEPASLPTLVFASASPNISEDDVVMVVSEIEASRGDTTREFADLVSSVACPFDQAWRHGYELALQLRGKLDLGYGPIEIEDVVADFGISVRAIAVSDPGVRAISFHDEGLTPTILINEHSPRTRRKWARAATVAHELCHLVFDDRLGRAVGVSSGPWAPVRFEQRANAFAVMFLMPEPEVSEVFEHSRGHLNQRIKMVARHFGASFRATVQHLSNLMLIERYERDSLLDDLEDFRL